uniref:1-phosphatidylinositol-3-phosphate 5-kinase n=1 Tax=Elaeis guineensis var. tenera TaxID=51953 RepID=A0A6I9QMD8_ELAGV|nr:1-phosphatidylinositol-3-phosphate 5-kinase FAB1A [Elaeis guineensis]
MNTMCHACGSEKTPLDSGYYCKICHHPICQECEKRDSSSALDDEYPVGHCKSCLEKYGKESLRMDGLSPYFTPLISPAPSLSSYGSCVSSLGDFPADLSSQKRENGVESLDTGQKHPDLRFTEHLENHRNRNSFKDIDIQSSPAKVNADGLEVSISTEGKISSLMLASVGHVDGSGEKYGLYNGMSGDVQSTRVGDDSDGTENAFDSSSPAFLSNFEKDPLIWTPPEPEDMEDDIDSVANFDDDDDYGDGTKWGQPSSLSSLDEENGSAYSFKEERQKAMLEAMNGQFKILASRLLASEGLNFSGREGGESWLDIVASLSWEAALLIKPDASEGRAMDPGSYVKVKCIASGTRNQSQVIKGLVFKKNAAHKRMPTKFRNPRLLLLQGALGHSAVGLSSFDSMEKEKNHLKSIIEMIETCQPNVVLVEKTVSRDIQESLLAKGITLVFDMKLPRLIRIARCTASPIICSADILMKLKLKQCESFHIERFVEEHNICGEGGKRPSKTLMFFEGFPKPLGCTILLKGAHSDELKKVKRVVYYTVFAAYHLILETSFFADQRLFFSGKNFVREGSGSFKDKAVLLASCDASPYSDISSIECSTSSITPVHALDIPISDGRLQKYAHEQMASISDLGAERSSLSPQLNPAVSSLGDSVDHRDLFCDKLRGSRFLRYDSSALLKRGQVLSSFSVSSKKYLGKSFQSHTSESDSSFSGFNEKMLDLPIFSSLEMLDRDKEATATIHQEKPDDRNINNAKPGLVSDISEPIERCTCDVSDQVEMQNKDDIQSVLDPQSILVLLSTQCITKQAVCEENHLSRINYYGNFDVSLGRFLQDVLLNKKHCCSSCGEPPESHVYRYTHQNGTLTVLVRQLRPESRLSGEGEGKIWMWTRCLRCARQGGIPKSTRRVVMSTAARGLSFGKFLELSFSSHSSASRLSKCGHSLHRDCLRFFGLGSKVAMFRYSSVEIYTACKPPPVIEFHNPHGQEWFKREMQNVLARAHLFFSEVAKMLQTLKLKHLIPISKQYMDISGSVEEFSEVEEMLIQEKTEFEASLLKAINHSEQLGMTVHEVFGLNWLNQELLLLLYVWDHRLHHLLQHKQVQQKKDGSTCNVFVERNMLEDGEKILGAPSQILMDVNESSSSSGNCHAQDIQTELQIESVDDSGDTSSRAQNFLDAGFSEIGSSAEQISDRSTVEEHSAYFLDQDYGSKPGDVSTPTGRGENGQEAQIPISDDMLVDHSIQVARERNLERVPDLELKIDETTNNREMSTMSMSKDHPRMSREFSNSKLEDPNNWIWAPFSELRRAYKRDLHGGSLQKFEFVNTYTPVHLSPMRQPSASEMGLLHFMVGPGGNVLSVSEDEISSIIACALAISQDRHGLLDSMAEKEAGESKGETDKTIVKSNSLLSNGSIASSVWSSTGCADYEGIQSSQSGSSISSEEPSTPYSDGSSSVDRLLASDDLHPEIPVGYGKVAGKTKYSVVCIYAKQFYALRKKWCPSELAYISSISRCKKWDAQGGKSKAFFAKSMDDRFIIKQIKKTELDSFLKFGPDYFKHISHSIESGSQTCLAKIVGIYQVRQYKSGKEVKTDLMVMENLLFGHSFSRIYDLKGAVFSRYVPDTNDHGKVLLDQNFIEDMRVSPIYIGGRTKHLLQRAIWNDTAFLTSINVMDYSLLVGVDKQRHELVFGIIDYLRQYTWDKQLETWVKSSLVVPKNSLPTVISPKEYKKRFRKFMTKYFMAVPDTWSSERCSDPCKFCIADSSNSFNVHSKKLPEQPIEACA